LDIQQEARDKVARLLALICTDETDADAYEYVLKELTRMSVLGTLPPGSRARGAKAPASVSTDDRHSEDKERWIAR